MMRKVWMIVACLGVAGTALACLHPPREYKGSVEASGHEVAIFFREGREELIFKVNYKTRGDTPTKLGWVVPVPTKPDEYAETDPGIFEDGFHYSDLYRVIDRDVKGPKEYGVAVIEKVTVGAYTITALKASGPEAATEFNKWLADNGFATYPAANLRYYLEKQWTFLAIQIAEPKSSGGFKPLRISFASPEPVYPAKLSAQADPFRATLYVYTERPLDTISGDQLHGLRVLTSSDGVKLGSALVKGDDLRWLKSYWEGVARNPLTPADLRTEAKRRVELIGKQDPRAETDVYKLLQTLAAKKIGKFEKVYFTRLDGTINTEQDRLINWKEDLFLKLSKK